MLVLLTALTAGLVVIAMVARTWLTGAYGALFLILVLFATNKQGLGLSDAMWADTFSPLSSLRWLTLGLFAGGSIAGHIARRSPHAVRSLLWTSLWSLTLAMLVSSVYSVRPEHTVLRAVSEVLLFGGLVSAVVPCVQAHPESRSYRDVLFWLSWVLLVPAFFLHLCGVNLHPLTDAKGRYVGLFQNPNMIGGFAALMAPLMIDTYHTSRGACRRLLVGVSVIAIFGMVWLTQSRGALLAMATGLGVYTAVVARRSRVPGALALLALTVALAAVYAIPTLETRFSRGGQITRVEQEARYAIWTGVLPEFMKSKWLGTGFGTASLATSLVVREKRNGYPVHNSFLELFGDLGFVGLGFFGLIMVQVIWQSTEVWRFERQIGRPDVSAADLGIISAGLANACVESWLFSVGNPLTIVFWTSVVTVGARWTLIRATRSRAVRWPVTSRRAVGALHQSAP